MPQAGTNTSFLEETYADSSVYAKAFFPEAFSRPFDQLHYDLFDVIDNREYLAQQQNSNPQLVVVAVPRGLGKSSILNVVQASKSIVFHEKHMILPVSHTSSQATQESENLKSQLMENPQLHQFFDIQKGGLWNQEKWVITSDGWETCVYPRGSGQSLRGARHRHWRPDLIIVDDLEDPDNLLSDEQRAKQKEWFYGSLLNTVDRGHDDWLVLVLGTIMHPNALLCNLLENPEWTSYELAIANKTLTSSNAPNFMPIQKIRKLYTSFKLENKVDTFYREYMNAPAPLGEDALVKSAWFKEYDEDKLRLNRNHEVINFLILDPARSTNIQSADSAIVGVGVNQVTNRIYIRTVFSGKVDVPELHEEIFLAAKLLNTNVVGIETTGLKQHITWPLQNEAMRRGIPLQIIELSARGGSGSTDDSKPKVRRFRPVIGLYQKGLIEHNKQFSQILEADLVSFPSPRKWDILDCIGYIPQMLEEAGIYMLGAGPEISPEERAELEEWEIAEKEFEHLTYEEPIGNWPGMVNSPFEEVSWDGVL